ncbi:carbamoyltransferase C-terminal domain-containing protein [Streptomyces avermitilis]|uniref:carbamoyltransferase C-terminal domain-containing protein n=1 Tax=Streptomyces avermitilis TaxID=33903 RepID=UPI003677B40A
MPLLTRSTSGSTTRPPVVSCAESAPTLPTGCSTPAASDLPRPPRSHGHPSAAPHRNGPGALGVRSILADPRTTVGSDALNQRIKHRGPFRPFASAILADHADTPGQKGAVGVLATGRAPVEHGFAHLKNWRTLTRLRTAPDRATHLLRALFVLTNLEVNR